MCNKELKRSAQNLKKKIQEEESWLLSLLNGFPHSFSRQLSLLKNNLNVEKSFEKHARFSFNTRKFMKIQR